ncbi:MAG: transcription elongation factor GreB [Gammaproteobacteria bacterium]|nr:MAG: transcription elongation factor GreB [Gammaproteobacteria bacterium]
MSRYRPPQEKSSPYITKDGYKMLQDELNALWDRRADVTRALTAAAAEGDRSENAEYIYRKKELREIDRRIRYLQKRLPDLKIVPAQQQDNKQIYFGAWVTVETHKGDEATYRIVGPDEFDPDKAYISLDSPLAKGLLKKTIDDEVIIHADGAKLIYVVIDVNYKRP